MTPVERRNLKLGLIIGGLCLAQLVIFIILFSRYGLPKDPKIWAEIQARESQKSAAQADQVSPGATSDSAASSSDASRVEETRP